MVCLDMIVDTAILVRMTALDFDLIRRNLSFVDISANDFWHQHYIGSTVDGTAIQFGDHFRQFGHKRLDSTEDNGI